MTEYVIGDERPGNFDGLEYPFMVDGVERGTIHHYRDTYTAQANYRGVPRLYLALAYADAQRQVEARHGRFSGLGVSVEVTVLAATTSMGKRLRVRGNGIDTEVAVNYAYEGESLAEWAVRKAMPDMEPVTLGGAGNGWTVRI